VSWEGERLGVRVRNTLRVLHASLGLNFTFGHWGKYTGDRDNGAMYVTLQQPDYNAVWLREERLAAPAVAEEARLLDAWASTTTIDLSAAVAATAGGASDDAKARLLALDDETRRAAYDTQLLPSSLLLLQAALSTPPTRSSKHGLPMLSRQWRKLSSEVNPRDEQRMLLERVEAYTGTGGAGTARIRRRQRRRRSSSTARHASSLKGSATRSSS
jgi:hypothetical protein